MRLQGFPSSSLPLQQLVSSPVRPRPSVNGGRARSSRLVRAADKEGATASKGVSSSDAAETAQASTSAEAPADGGTVDIATTAARFAAEAVASPVFYLVAGLAAIKLVSSTGEQAGSILAFAAAPLVLLTALSKSSLGQRVQDALEERLPVLEAEAAALREAHQEARAASPHFGPQRPLLPAALGGAQPHLRGEVAGDYGFDPLGLAKEPAAFKRLHEAELLHARWAMLAAVGCLVPEALSAAGLNLGEAVWWKVGGAKLRGGVTLNYGGIEGFRIAGKQGVGLIAACQAVLMGGPEYARYVGIRSLEPVGVFLPGYPDCNYPGGTPFDPLGYSRNPREYVDQQVKEIKNGRLAMVAMAGYFAQAAVTREGPLANLTAAFAGGAAPAHAALLDVALVAPPLPGGAGSVQ